LIGIRPPIRTRFSVSTQCSRRKRVASPGLHQPAFSIHAAVMIVNPS
jgi:hypothetical protein